MTEILLNIYLFRLFLFNKMCPQELISHIYDNFIPYFNRTSPLPLEVILSQ